MKRILDLTKPLTSSLPTYADGVYRDPDFACVDWASIDNQGFRVSAVTLGTQTGTHIDAPAHFDSAGRCLEVLPIEKLIGRYFLLDLSKNMNEDQMDTLCAAYNSEPILFIRTHESGESFITSEALDILLKLPPSVWVLDGEVKITNGRTFEFHRLLAGRQKYLIENLRSDLARTVNPGGELIALPLALVGTSGAPCRVIVRE